MKRRERKNRRETKLNEKEKTEIKKRERRNKNWRDERRERM